MYGPLLSCAVVRYGAVCGIRPRAHTHTRTHIYMTYICLPSAASRGVAWLQSLRQSLVLSLARSESESSLAFVCLSVCLSVCVVYSTCNTFNRFVWPVTPSMTPWIPMMLSPAWHHLQRRNAQTHRCRHRRRRRASTIKQSTTKTSSSSHSVHSVLRESLHEHNNFHVRWPRPALRVLGQTPCGHACMHPCMNE